MPNAQMLRDMALFVEVAKQKSFSKAAATLGMPISSLSRRISDFEQMVGLRLLDRTTRKLALTSYGEAYLAQASRLVEEAQQAFDNLVAEAKGPSGFLRIVAPPDFWVLHHLSRIVTEFSELHEHIHVHVDLKPSAIDLVGDNYDLAVTIEEPRETSLIMRKVAEVRNGLFASPAYLRDCGWPKEPQDLRDHSAIVPTQGARTMWSLSRDDETVPVLVNGPLSCNSPSLARKFALAGQGIFSTHHLSVERDVVDGRLEQVLPEWDLPPTPVYIVTTSRLLPAKARSFIDFAMKQLPSMLPAIAGNGAS
ncbi:putative transcriptional regulator, LysR family [Methylorubrum extorquens DM4]|uniref:Transcriptional regulator, LysR family n=2 Tax=Methylorubrum extorquens TaxID=408 RepID=C7CEL8_METED|nr:putative transcriptional regulator, LysR family [Methylorubrum extorquens DM4]